MAIYTLPAFYIDTGHDDPNWDGSRGTLYTARVRPMESAATWNATPPANAPLYRWILDATPCKMQTYYLGGSTSFPDARTNRVMIRVQPAVEILSSDLTSVSLRWCDWQLARVS